MANEWSNYDCRKVDGNVTIAVTDAEGERRGWSFVVLVTDPDTGTVYACEDAVNTPSGATKHEAIRTAAGFLDAWQESVDYRSRGGSGENADLFNFGPDADAEHVASLVDWSASLLSERERESLSSGHFSVDTQLADVVRALTDDQRAAFLAVFPEWPNLVWSLSWIDADASGVDVDYPSWAIDWIEENTSIVWEDGEPYRYSEEDA